MKKRLITVNDLLFLMIVLVISILGNDNILNSSVLPHIKAGQWMLEHGKIMSTDYFSYTMEGAKWININWGMQLIYGALYNNFGLRGIVSFTALTIGLTFLLIVNYAGRKRINLLVYFPILLFGIYLSTIQWIASPFTINMLFCVIYFIFLDDYFQNNSKKLYFLPVIQILWINLNADYVYGYYIVLIFIAAMITNIMLKKDINILEIKSKLKKVFIILSIMIAAVVINPFGFNMITETARLYREVFIYRLGDWKSPNFNGIMLNIAYFWVIIVFLITLIGKKSKEIKFEYIYLFLFWQFMFLYAQRNSVLFILFILLLMPNLLDGLNSENKILKNLFEKTEVISEKFCNSGGLRAGIIFVFLVIITLFVMNDKIEKRYPTAIWNQVIKPIEYMEKNGISGKGIHTDMYGNIIIWKMYPKMKVFIDNRANFYSTKIMDDYGKIYSLKSGWEDTVKKYNPEWFICRGDSTYSTIIEKFDKTWEKVYDDGYTTIFTTKEYYKKNRDKIKLEINTTR